MLSDEPESFDEIVNGIFDKAQEGERAQSDEVDV